MIILEEPSRLSELERSKLIEQFRLFFQKRIASAMATIIIETSPCLTVQE